MRLRRIIDAIRTGGLSERKPARPDDWSFCEQPRCQAKNDGYCHVPENCGHFMPKYPRGRS